jgi:hypothetical protein|tara:strand:+ start:486 stop:1016 length:531 start_codon:yes stop_codon:yes gene_type:complete
MKLISYEFLVDILIHVSILTVILTVFYYKIAIKLEKNSLSGILKDNVLLLKKENSDIVELIKTNLEKYNGKENIDKMIDAVNIQSNNKIILRNSILIVSAIVLLTILVTTFLVFTKRLNFKQLLKLLGENIIVFMIIVIIEAIFFFQVILEYVPVKESYIYQELIKEINNNISNNK